MKYACGALAFLLCAGSVIPAQESGPASLLFVTRVSAQSANPVAAAPSALDKVTGYRDLVPKLQSKTKVPLRLPTFVPYDNDKDNPLFASLQSANPDAYEVELAWIADCNSGGACHLGYIDGSTSALSENTGPKIPVVLNGGIKGYFIDSSCAASCSDPPFTGLRAATIIRSA